MVPLETRQIPLVVLDSLREDDVYQTPANVVGQRDKSILRQKLNTEIRHRFDDQCAGCKPRLETDVKISQRRLKRRVKIGVRDGRCHLADRDISELTDDALLHSDGANIVGQPRRVPGIHICPQL